MFLVELVCCLSVRPSDYLKSNKRSLSRAKEQQLDFGDDPDYSRF